MRATQMRFIKLIATQNCERSEAIQENNTGSLQSHSLLCNGEEVIGFIIGKLMPAPEVYNPGGLTLMISALNPKTFGNLLAQG